MRIRAVDLPFPILVGRMVFPVKLEQAFEIGFDDLVRAGKTVPREDLESFPI